jgi:CysZ protein
MIAGAISRAIAQLPDPRFRRVLLLGVGLTVALLFAVTVVFVTVVGWLVPETVTLPWIGEITWINNALSWAVVPVMLVFSVFLMVPVASAFTGIFLDDVADAVEAKHYAHLDPAPSVSFAVALRDSAGFLGVIVAANLAALVLYVLFAPLAPVIFLALNGYLLGREYFQLVAMRRLGRAGAKAARRRNAGTIWLMGAIMALPLAVPVVNLLVPVLGAAAFTHLFHRLEGRQV